jgi:hypothetical protein
MSTYVDRLLSFSVRHTDRRVAVRLHSVIEVSLSVRQAGALVRLLNETLESFKPIIENDPLD